MAYTKALSAAGGFAAGAGAAATGAFGGATRAVSAAGAMGANQALGASRAAAGSALAFTGLNVGWDVLAAATACILGGLVLRFVPRKAKV
ncbi:MAG TPA: hypothetical protein VMF65_06400 [Acidimicrobiales bacterium]|nr:hypothetical protein [Acidimicrobiales bacterium]